MTKRNLREDTMTVIVETIIIDIDRMADAITIMIEVIGAIIEIKTKIMRKKSLRIILIQILGSIIKMIHSFTNQSFVKKNHLMILKSIYF